MGKHVEYRPEWVREDFVDFLAEKINPLWAWKKAKAQIVAKHHLSDDFVCMQLQPNRHFKVAGYQAGQSILVTVLIGGVRWQRSYSIVEILDNGNLVIAVRKQGKVSNTLTQQFEKSVVEISQSQGEFVLKTQPHSALMIASGSGITAIYALINAALKQTQIVSHIDLIYFTRDDAFHLELQRLAELYPQFKYHHINTLLDKQHLSQDLLSQKVEGFEQRECYACGAANMMQSLTQIYQGLDLIDHLHTEYFQITVDHTQNAQMVTFQRSQQQFQAQSNLLESAEQAGLRPAHGCRMGICNTCSCTKVQGVVRNLLTGELDQNNNTQIKLCISQAVSPVVINL